MELSPAMVEKIEKLIDQMTVSEKAAIFKGVDSWHTKAIERLGIPAIKVTDGPYGCRTIPDDTPNRFLGMPANCYPTGSAMAATWNPELVGEIGKAIGEETKSKGADIILGPAINIHRSPLGGRNFEYQTEDPHLNARLAVAYVNGVQSQGVGTSIKHFAGNNQEFERDFGNSIIDERTLNEIYFEGFRAAVEEAQPWTVMCSYNKLNGTYASENHSLLVENLKEKWGFKGFVVSDWGAVHDRVAASLGGMDLEMPGRDANAPAELVAAIESGVIPEEVVNDRLRRFLRVVALCGAFDAPKTCDPQAADTPAHRAVALRAAEEAMTLLKNQDNFLPLKADALKTIAVVGPFAAKATIQGGGSANVNPYYTVSPLQGVREMVGDSVNILHAAGIRVEAGDSFRADDFELAVAYAAQADVTVLCVGLADGEETEAYDRQSMNISAAQMELMEAVLAANPNTVVLLHAGAPVQMHPWLEKARALLLTWYSGQESGRAAAHVLFGKVNPSGKLPTTFPHRLQDNPAYLNYPGDHQKVLYGEGVFVGYRYYDKVDRDVAFPFGFGLSYTTFTYSDLQVPAAVEGGAEVKLSVTVTNIGKVAGKETVQVYLHDCEASVKRPCKELKAFKKVELAPGESKVIDFTLPNKALAFYDDLLHDWRAEAGMFEVLVGASSRDIRLKAAFKYDAANIPPRLNRSTMLLHILQDPQGRAIVSKYFGDLSSIPFLQFAKGSSLERMRRFAARENISESVFDSMIAELEAIE